MRIALAVNALVAVLVSTTARAAEDDCRWSKAQRLDQTVTCPGDILKPVPNQDRVFELPPAGTVKINVLYIDTLLRDTSYRFWYNRMISASKFNPTWLRRFHTSGDGSYKLVKIYKLSGVSYQQAAVCSVDDSASCLYSIFQVNDDGPEVAYGYYTGDGVGKWIGVPPLDLAEYVERKIGR